jgi:gliding motility-associated lipoprotein GldH
MSRIPEKKTLLFILLMIVIVSCDSNRLFEEHTTLEKGVWNMNKPVRFTVGISDLISRYNVYLNVRNGQEYAYSNLFMFMTTTFPDGKVARDTVELTLADYDGRWLGSGMGSVKFSKFLFEKGIQFKQAGNYVFSFEQAMRVADLKGIYDLGMRIEKQ